jgi:hypothetical protein
METPGPNDPTERRDAPPPPQQGYGPGPGQMLWTPGARLPIPGNAEWVMWFFVEILFAIVWAASDAVDAGTFVQVTAIVTFAYLISRGIAKASRVLEH